jgi:hypothetical protein
LQGFAVALALIDFASANGYDSYLSFLSIKILIVSEETSVEFGKEIENFS